MLKTGETSVREPPEMTLHNMRFVIKMLLHGLDYSLLKKCLILILMYPFKS